MTMPPDPACVALWLRDELKPGERRAALAPASVAELVAAGLQVTVERSIDRVFEDADYAAAGAVLVDSGAWRSAPPDALIVGLKELDAEHGPFTRRHLHFAHAFKRQRGWDTLLRAFDSGGGQLFDLEYLVDEQGLRVAAFGYWAGYVGAALGVMALASERAGRGPLAGPLTAWADQAALERDVLGATQALRTSGRQDEPLRALVFGARGRSGRGAVDLLQRAGIDITPWDVAETRGGVPFDAVLAHELVINCVFVAEPVAPFTTRAALSDGQRRTAVIVDVSCDPFGEANVLPIYDLPTTLDAPVRRLLLGEGGSPALDLVAIDHLPSLLPHESSDDFARQLLPSLLALASGGTLADGPFARAASVFERERAAAVAMTAATEEPAS